MVEERSLIEASGRTQVCVRNRCWNVHLGIQFFHCAGESDSDQWTGNVPSRHFFLSSVLAPTHVVYSKLRGFTKNSLLASLSPFTLFSKTGAGTLPEDLDSTPLHLSTKKEAKQQFGMPCLRGPIPQGTWIQVVSSVSMSHWHPMQRGRLQSQPRFMFPTDRSGQLWGQGDRWLWPSSFASLFPPCWQGGWVLTLQILLKQLQFTLSSMRIQLGLFLLQHRWSPVFSLSVCADQMLHKKESRTAICIRQVPKYQSIDKGNSC